MKYLTVKEFAAARGVSEPTVRREIRLGRLTSMMPRGMQRGMVIPETELARWRAGEGLEPYAPAGRR